MLSELSKDVEDKQLTINQVTLEALLQVGAMPSLGMAAALQGWGLPMGCPQANLGSLTFPSQVL